MTAAWTAKGANLKRSSRQGKCQAADLHAIFNLPWGFDQRFLIIGVAEFENGIKAMGQIKVDSVDKLKTGMKVKATWEPIRVQYGEDVYGLMFAPMD